MTSREQEILLNTFLEAAGGQWRGVAVNDLLEVLAAALEERTARTEAAPQAARTTAAAPSAAQGTGSSTASTVLNTALGMFPMAKAIVSLFKGGEPEAPEPLTRFALPASLRFEAANSRSGFTTMDYGQEGLPRFSGGRQTAGDLPREAILPEYLANAAVPAESGWAAVPPYIRSSTGRPERPPQAGGLPHNEREWAGGQSGAAAPAPQVTIQVQAMDSRSFLDHSAEIAQAVREAMLNMHSLNDVVSDL